MGAIWLLSMPDVLRRAGLDVDVYPGWQTRSRSTGGYNALHGVQCHHTASNTTPLNDMRYMWEGSPDRPIGAIHLARNAKVTVGAAGATNTSGKGGPLGPIPLDKANLSVISVEAANAGNGQPWTPEQQEAYLILVNALVEEYDFDYSIPGVHAHFEWTSRKIDPAGSSRWASGANKWDMHAFRRDASRISAPAPVPAPPAPPTTPDPNLVGVPDMFVPIQPFRNSDTRGYGGYGIPVADHKFGLNPSVFPANVTAVAVNITAINTAADGYVTVWPGGARPNASCLNYKGGPGAVSASAVVGVEGLAGFSFFTSAVGHFIVDVTGYWTP